MISLRPRLVTIAAQVIGAIARSQAVPSGLKKFAINVLFQRYYSWRSLAVSATTVFGARMHLRLPDTVQSTIFLTGRWEPAISSIISRALGSGDVFVDIGANVGYYSLLASSRVGLSGRVFAFEASPSIYRQLQENISLNEVANVTAVNCAISDSEGTISIWSAPSANLGHSTVIEKVAKADGHTFEAKVRCNTLAELVPGDLLLSARFVKIDIEGAERMAIQGVLHLLPHFSDATEWLVELSPDFSPGGRSDTDWIFWQFVANGYRAYLVENAYEGAFAAISAKEDEVLVELTVPPEARLNDILFTKRGPEGLGRLRRPSKVNP